MKPFLIGLLTLSCGLVALRQDSLNVRRLGSSGIPQEAHSVAVSGDYAYLTDYYHGLRIFSIGDLTNPTQVGYLQIPCCVNGVAVAGNHAYVATWDGLRVIDVSTPSVPVEAGFCPLETAQDVVVNGNYAYVVGYWVVQESFLFIVDIADPTAPLQIGSIVMHGYVQHLAVNETYAYVADQDGRLLIFNVSNPFVPAYVSQCPMLAIDVAVHQDCAYVVDGRGGLRVVDVSNPAAPVAVGFCSIPGWLCRVVISGDHAYVASFQNGVRVVDIGSPAAPCEIGYYDPPDSALCVDAAGPNAYLAGVHSLGIYDVSAAIGWSGALQPPQNLVVRFVPQGQRFELSWSPVTADTLGAPVSVARYVVYRTMIPGTVGDSLGVPFPPDTTFFIDSASFGQGDKFFYQVRAVAE